MVKVFGDVQAPVVRERSAIGGREHGHTWAYSALIGERFHTACRVSLCNSQTPEQLRRSTGCCRLHTLDDTLSLQEGLQTLQ